MKRLSNTEIDDAMEESMGQLPTRMSNEQLAAIREEAQAKQQPYTVRGFSAPYTNLELAQLREASQRKGAPLDDKEVASALGKKYVAPDPMGLRRLPNYVEVQ